MSDQNYPKAHGALFLNNEKRANNHPDFRGNIEVSPDQIRSLIEMAKRGLEVKLQVAGWNKVSKGGVAYISMETEAYMKDENPQYPPQQTSAPPQYQQPQIPQAPQQPQYQQPAPQPQVPQPQVPQQPAPQPGFDIPDDDIPF